MDIIKLIKEYIVNSAPKSVAKFKNLQERDLWLRNTELKFESLTLEDLNGVIDLVEFEQKSGSFYGQLYNRALSKLFLDIDITQHSLIEIADKMEEIVKDYRLNTRANMLISKILGSSICNILKSYKDDYILEFVRTNKTYRLIVSNYILRIADEYFKSDGKVSYGLSDYTLRNIIEIINKEKMEKVEVPIKTEELVAE